MLVLSSSGADVSGGVASLHSWGQAARALALCSGLVPVVIVVTGPALSGPALLLGLADVVIMTGDAFAFVSGPTMVEEFTGIKIGVNQLGGVPSTPGPVGCAPSRPPQPTRPWSTWPTC